MSLKHEIVRAFFVALGFFEIYTNSVYLFKKNSLEKARKQHQEIPSTCSTKQLKRKVIMMFISGILFFIVGFGSCLFHTYDPILFLSTLILFCIYALSEACYYRYWKTFGFFTVSIVMTILCVL